MTVQYLVMWLRLYHVTRISTNARSVSGQVAPSAISHVYIYIYEFWYNFDTVLYHFLESQGHQKELILVAYTPLNSTLPVPVLCLQSERKNNWF